MTFRTSLLVAGLAASGLAGSVGLAQAAPAGPHAHPGADLPIATVQYYGGPYGGPYGGYGYGYGPRAYGGPYGGYGGPYGPRFYGRPDYGPRLVCRVRPGPYGPRRVCFER